MARHIKRRFLLVGILISYTTASALYASEVTIPDTTVLVNQDFTIPIITSDLVGLNVFSFDAELLYDAEFINYAGLDNNGTLSQKFLIAVNPNVPGEIRISAASADSIYEHGNVLLYLKFAAKNIEGEAAIAFESFKFSDNVLASERIPTLHNGLIKIETTTSVGRDDDSSELMHENVSLYPNPFNGYLTIEYTVPAYKNVAIEIFDVLGRKIRKLLNAMQGAGKYSIKWDGSSDHNRPVPSGIYFCRLSIGNNVKIVKISYIR